MPIQYNAAGQLHAAQTGFNGAGVPLQPTPFSVSNRGLPAAPQGGMPASSPTGQVPPPRRLGKPPAPPAGWSIATPRADIPLGGGGVLGPGGQIKPPRPPVSPPVTPPGGGGPRLPGVMGNNQSQTQSAAPVSPLDPRRPRPRPQQPGATLPGLSGGPTPRPAAPTAPRPTYPTTPQAPAVQGVSGQTEWAPGMAGGPGGSTAAPPWTGSTFTPPPPMPQGIAMPAAPRPVQVGGTSFLPGGQALPEDAPAEGDAPADPGDETTAEDAANPSGTPGGPFAAGGRGPGVATNRPETAQADMRWELNKRAQAGDQAAMRAMNATGGRLRMNRDEALIRQANDRQRFQGRAGSDIRSAIEQARAAMAQGRR